MSQFDDERERARAAILKRRAQLVAYAVAAGVSVPACGGSYCLSFADPNGGRSSGGSSSAAGNGATAGYCLSVAGTNTYGGYGGTGGGVACLSAPYGGESFGGEGGADGGAGAVAGNAGQAGEPPVYCLTPPAAPALPDEPSDEDR
jgi:hypothetical protein